MPTGSCPEAGFGLCGGGRGARAPAANALLAGHGDGASAIGLKLEARDGALELFIIKVQ